MLTYATISTPLHFRNRPQNKFTNNQSPQSSIQHKDNVRMITGTRSAGVNTVSKQEQILVGSRIRYIQC
jgi:hypothetical protein